MQPYQQRVVDEASELRKKLEALNVFISSNETYQKLTEEERERLARQSRVMGDYLAVLQERISAF
ncbi:hypothetical protein RJM00_003000 [Salmonella enterica]|uniref:crAss001_48 related protein n=1 Tax=Escherichia coli TaxID=562 RepID=UPI00127A8410|nr:hypothetical protein [Escherichia coli]EBV7253333.1 hypothetical protein [Salmonella enterica subsp. enterica serovar Pomona]ECF3884325.1 hypothetical protein [Salmonella enterica subsp. enterica serovar Ank]ELC5633217.1 hypothetical protein [Salmonella enterica]EEJ1803230.1 hypothetical protein [Salmonella enterica subsp. enterica serovar Pomona]ELC5701534.1 hypothetical protein [Salmonella enterica]